MTETESKELLIDEDTFLTCGVHIGTKQKSRDMEPYVHKVREDGLRILNVNLTSEKIVVDSLQVHYHHIRLHSHKYSYPLVLLISLNHCLL